MAIIPAQKIESLLVEIFIAAQTPEDIARQVAASLTESSLMGVDSHGVMRVSLYVDQILSGDIKPAARPEIQQEAPTTAIVEGHWGFGIFAMEYAVNVAVEKAKKSHVASVGLTGCTHTGRLGQFAAQAAKRNVLVIISGGGRRQGPGVSVAPYGGAKPIFATNPYAIGMPGGHYGAVVADFATSTVAEGKLQVYRENRQPLPPGWIVDKAGNPSANVEDFYNGGMLLPFAGHKGYSLALVAEFLSSLLLGKPRHPTHWLHWNIIAIDVAAFRPIEDYLRDAEELLQETKSIPPMAGFEEVLLPGEPEDRTLQRRRLEGIPIPDQVWNKIENTARRVGVVPNMNLET